MVVLTVLSSSCPFIVLSIFICYSYRIFFHFYLVICRDCFGGLETKFEHSRQISVKVCFCCFLYCSSVLTVKNISSKSLFINSYVYYFLCSRKLKVSNKMNLNNIPQFYDEKRNIIQCWPRDNNDEAYSVY